MSLRRKLARERHPFPKSLLDTARGIRREEHPLHRAMFQKEADSGDPAQVTDFAKQTLPTLKKHLQTAQSLQK